MCTVGNATDSSLVAVAVAVAVGRVALAAAGERRRGGEVRTAALVAGDLTELIERVAADVTGGTIGTDNPTLLLPDAATDGSAAGGSDATMVSAGEVNRSEVNGIVARVEGAGADAARPRDLPALGRVRRVGVDSVVGVDAGRPRVR
jgi:hypothetical protein